MMDDTNDQSGIEVREEREEKELSKDEEVVVGVRSERFVDKDDKQILKSGNINDLKCFYDGELVHERMSLVRKSIYNIRNNWEKFDQFMAKLKDFMEEQARPSGGLSHHIRKIFDRPRNWADIQPTEEVFSGLTDEFNVIFAYTTKEGFAEVFKICDKIFRSESSVKYGEVIENAVFLIELINIDLFNYVHKYPQRQNYSGVVYRGMAIQEQYFATFETIMKQPVNKRYISIPLGLWSSSFDRDVAVNFIKDQLRNSPSCVPLLMKINILNVDEQLLEFYRKKFGKRSIVSSICAVDISKLSMYEMEKEVLLRGGFYQTVNFYDEEIEGINFKVLEFVMLNSNRDHLSTSTLLQKDEDGEARALFGTMVGFTRNRFIVDYCKQHNLKEDFNSYSLLFKESEEKLKKLMTS